MSSGIIGYQQLTDKQLAKVNEVKQLEIAVIDAIATALEEGANPRMAAIAKTQMQMGFMCLTRALTRPEE